jgi:TolB-like protein/Tfp pilus assembly protein PilF
MPLYQELKRRNVFRVAIAYLAAAWLLAEVAGTLFPVFGIPDWGVRFLVIVFALGFVQALIVSWVYEITPEGLKREKDVVRDASITHLTARRLDLFTIGLIVVALAFILADRLWLSPGQVEQSAPASQYPSKSIAVLPFVNMSDDASNEYFSDGISEELLNLLAKIPQLRVIARTSSFAYKGKDLNIADIAQDLNVNHVLEGSVRKAGNQVRITAQLIRAADSSYDRTLDNIFAIQDEIASAVVAQLEITLLGNTPTIDATDPEAYALYLKGRHVRRQVTTEGPVEGSELLQAQALLQKALAIDPGFAAAWNELGSVYLYQREFMLRPIDEAVTLAREATNKALAIDPDYALAHVNLSWIAGNYDNDPATAARHCERALQLEPTNTEIILDAASLTAALGRLNEAIALAEYVVSRDPISVEGHIQLGGYQIYAGRWDEAIASYRTILMLSPNSSWWHYSIGVALLLKGEPQAALEAFQKEADGAWRLMGLVMAHHALGDAAASDAALAALIEQNERDAAYNIAYVLAYRGEADRAFEWLDKAVVYQDSGLLGIVRQPLFANIHNDPRWLPFLERIGRSPEQLPAIEFKVTLPK